MKAKLLKFLRFVGYIVPLFVGLMEKLALGLIKKLTGFTNWSRSYLDRVKQRDCPLEILKDECLDESNGE